MKDNKIQVAEDVLFWAFRYCLSRRSYAVLDAVKAIRENWDHLSYNTQRMIHKEIEQKISDDALDPCDKSLWDGILRLPKKSDKMEVYPTNRLDGKVGIE